MKKYSLWLALSLCISLIAARYLITSSHFHTHDDIQVFRLQEYISCWEDGQIPCRWSANLGGGYGYPLFIFYPPAIYAIAGAISSLGFSLITSLNILALITFPLATYSMYKLVHTLTKNPNLSAFAAILFTLMPYRALNIFVRGVYAETLALSIFPLILERAYSLVVEKKNSLHLAFLLSLVILTHNISAFFILPITIAWIALLIITRKHTGGIKISLINLILPATLCAFFLGPALLEKNLVQTESMVFDYYSYIVHFVSLSQIFTSDYWGYGGSSYGVENDGMSFMIGKLIWIPALTALVYYLYKSTKTKWKGSANILFFTVLSGIFIFLTHSRSIFIWQAIPMIEYVQFPWRFIGIGSMFLIITLALSLDKILSNAIPFTVMIVTVVILTYLPFFKPEKYDTYEDVDFLTGNLKIEQQYAHIYDYLPKTVSILPDEPKSNYPLRYEGTITAQDSTSRSLNMLLDSESDQSIILPVFDYPGWTASIDNTNIEHSTTQNGLIEIPIPAGQHHISLEFTETTSRRIFNYVSLISLMVAYSLSRKYREEYSHR